MPYTCQTILKEHRRRSLERIGRGGPFAGYVQIREPLELLSFSWAGFWTPEPASRPGESRGLKPAARRTKTGKALGPALSPA